MQNLPSLLNRHGFRGIWYHDLRNSCASLLLASGIGMKEIKEWPGPVNTQQRQYIFTSGV